MDINGRWEIEDYRALKTALGTGARSVRYGDQQVDYQSPQQMRDTLAAMERELGINQPRRNTYRPGFSKGL